MAGLQQVNASAALGDYEPPVLSPDDPPIPTIREVAHACADYYQIPIRAILSERRQAKIVRARHVTYYLCLELTLRSSSVIAKALGDFDHSTVLKGIGYLKHRMRKNPQISADIDAIRAMLGQQRGTA